MISLRTINDEVRTSRGPHGRRSCGTLFAERCAYTASYSLSPAEADLYQAVTTYVREEMNRADRTGDDKRRMNVGFALQILQRRLASSPAAIRSIRVRVQDTADICVSNKFRQFAALSERNLATTFP